MPTMATLLQEARDAGEEVLVYFEEVYAAQQVVNNAKIALEDAKAKALIGETSIQTQFTQESRNNQLATLVSAVRNAKSTLDYCKMKLEKAKAQIRTLELIAALMKIDADHAPF